MSFRLRLVFGLGILSGVLLACNAIVGVEDVRLRSGRGLADADDDGNVTPEDDAGDGYVPPGVDRGTLAMGDNHVCARLPTGSVKCWGDNTSGQLGDGLAFDAGTRANPAKVPQAVPGLADVLDIASGSGHTCAVKTDGAVVCWGRNTSGQLGNDTTTSSTTPVQVLQLASATAVTASDYSTCALLQDKTVSCWGANTSGQLGTGNETASLHAVPVVGLTNVTSISGGSSHVCAVDESAKIWCWGGNTFGQLGNGSTTKSSSPVAITSLANVAQVAAGFFFTCAVQKTGAVFCWGVNDHGQLGNGTTAPIASPNPSPIAVNLNDAVWISTNGENHACAVKRTGSVACWGDSVNGQLGYSNSVDGSVPSPVQVAPPVTNAQRVWTASDTSCAITTDGRAYCWGLNTYGQVGDNSTVTRYTPTQVSAFP